MKKERNHSLYLVALGIFLFLLFFEFAYQQPRFRVELTFTEFDLTTTEGVALGGVNSSIQVAYEPGDNSKIGQFIVVIDTSMEEPHRIASVYSRDITYEVNFLFKGEKVAGLIDNYLGSSNIVASNTLYNSRTFPSINHPMLDIRSRVGLLRLKIEGTYYDSMSGRVLDKGDVTIEVLIIPPLAKLITFTLIVSILCLWYALVDYECISCGKKVQSLRVNRGSQRKCPECGEYMLSEN